MGGYTLHRLAVNYRLQTQHAVGRGVVRADVDHVVVVVEETLLGSHQVTVFIERVLYGKVALRLIGTGEAVSLGAHVEVLAQGMTLEVGTQEEPAHIGMPQELNAHEVVHFAFQQVGHVPQVDYRGYHVRAIYLLGDGLDRATLVVLCVFENIYTSETFLTEVFTDDGNKVIEVFLVLQLGHFRGEAVKAQFYIV